MSGLQSYQCPKDKEKDMCVAVSKRGCWQQQGYNSFYSSSLLLFCCWRLLLCTVKGTAGASTQSFKKLNLRKVQCWNKVFFLFQLRQLATNFDGMDTIDSRLEWPVVKLLTRLYFLLQLWVRILASHIIKKGRDVNKMMANKIKARKEYT